MATRTTRNTSTADMTPERLLDLAFKAVGGFVAANKKGTRDADIWAFMSGCPLSTHTSEAAAHPNTIKLAVPIGNGDIVHATHCGVCGTVKFTVSTRVSVYAPPGWAPDAIVSDVIPPVAAAKHLGRYNRKDDGSFALRTAARDLSALMG